MRNYSSKYTVWKESADLFWFFIQMCWFALIFRSADICWFFFLRLLLFYIFNLVALVCIHERAELRTKFRNVTNLYVWTMKTSLPSMNWADHWTIWRDPFFVHFSDKHKRTGSEVWTTVSTNLVIRRTWCNLCNLDNDYCSVHHFEFKDSPESLQYIQTSETVDLWSSS